MNGLKIIFMGTPVFSVPILRALINGGHSVNTVFTRMMKVSSNRLQIKTKKSPVHNFAESHGLFVSVQDLSSLTYRDKEMINLMTCDVIVISSYGQIIPESILNIPQFGCLNIHASLLPRWRGASPIQRSIQSGDLKSGVTIIKAEAGIDTGPILSMAEIPIKAETTAEMLCEDLSHLGASMINSTLKGVLDGSLVPIHQPSIGITYAHKIRKEDGWLNWDKEAIDLEREVRAFLPWPGTFFHSGQIFVKVHKATVVNQSGTPGRVLDDRLTVACGQNALRILEVQPSGRKVMAVNEFLNGYALTKGTQLSCHYDEIQDNNRV